MRSTRNYQRIGKYHGVGYAGYQLAGYTLAGMCELNCRIQHPFNRDRREACLANCAGGSGGSGSVLPGSGSGGTGSGGGGFFQPDNTTGMQPGINPQTGQPYQTQNTLMPGISDNTLILGGALLAGALIMMNKKKKK